VQNPPLSSQKPLFSSRPTRERIPERYRAGTPVGEAAVLVRPGNEAAPRNDSCDFFIIGASGVTPRRDRAERAATELRLNAVAVAGPGSRKGISSCASKLHPGYAPVR
jgi:hypothetical protein